MAKPKVQSTAVKRKSRKDELKQPDEVKSALQALSEHLNKNFNLYLIGLAVLIIAVLGIDSLVKMYQAKEVAQSKKLTDSISTLNSSVTTYAADESLLPLTAISAVEAPKGQFPNDKERWSSAARISASLQNELPPKLASLAVAAEARAQMGLGEWSAASDLFKKYAEQNADSSLKLIVIENRGRAAESAGNTGDAATYFQQLAESPDLYYQVRGHVSLGDLYNPVIGKGDGKDGAKARKHYDDALTALTPKEGQALGAALRTLRSEIRRRQALIGQ